MKAMSSASGATGGFVMKVDHSNDCMVAFMIPSDIGQKLLELARSAGLPEDALQPLDQLHITLAYLGDLDEDNVSAPLSSFAKGWPTLSGNLNGVGRFVDADDHDVIYLNFDSPELPRFRHALVFVLKGENIDPVENHGYTPHLTLAYVDKSFPTPTIPLDPIPVQFSGITLAQGDNYELFPFGISQKAEDAMRIVKDKKTDKYRVLNESTGERQPAEGYDTRREATEHMRAFYEAKKTSLDGDDDSALIQVGHNVYWREPVPPEHQIEPDEETMCWGVVKEINGGVATIIGPDGSVVQKNLSDLEPDQADDTNEPPVQPTPEPVQPMVGKSADDDEGMHYAYPEEKKLKMPDAGHVVLAAAALGPNPPHGNRADIPADKLGEVKARIRARAHALGLGKEEMDKVNAYLSGKMPEDVSQKDFDVWAKVYNQALAETGDETKAALAAQGAINRRAMVGVKSVNGLPTSVAGWMMLFSDPDNLDLQETYFDQLTRTYVEYYPTAPLWYEHGKDASYGAEPIGIRTFVKVYPRGIWAEHDLHTTHPQYSKTASEVANGEVAYSSDSLPHYVADGYDPADGHLGEWPLAGCSLTRNPAEPGLGPVLGAKSFEIALKSVAQKREASETSDGATNHSTSGENSMDPEEDIKGLEEVNDENDNFDAPDEEAPQSTLDALAQMYGCEAQPDIVRKAMDDHIVKIKTAGPHPDLVKALGLPADCKADDVANHLNNLYTSAMTSKDDVPPEPVMAAPAEPNYNVLHHHLASGGAKSVGPYMTGSIAQKGINNLSGITKTPLTGFYADLLRIRRMERPKYVLGQKAMTSATGPTGGYILHQEIAPTVLDPLRAKIVAYQLGAEKIDMQGTNVLTIPVMNSAPDASWIGENQAATDSQPGYRTVTLYPHGLECLVKVPFNVEANMTPQAEKQLRSQMAKSIGLKIDKAAMLGTGGALSATTGMEIVGILNTPATQTYDMGNNGRQPTFIDIGQAFGLLDDANVPFDDESRRGIAFHSQISRNFSLATDSLGNPLLRPAWRDASEREIMAMPYGISNQIPTNVAYGTATNASYIFGGDWQYMYIGLSDQVEIRLDQTFAGNLQAGLLIYVYADVKIVYPQGFFVMKGVLPVSIAGVTTGSNTLN